MRYSLRTLLLLVAVVPIIIAGLVCVPQAVWDGRFDLNVRFVNKTGKAVSSIEATSVYDRRTADLYLAYPQGEQPPWRILALDNNDTAQIEVKCFGRESQFTGIEFSYGQFGAIVIRVKFSDGSTSLFAVNTPERGKRQLDINIL